MTKKKNFCLFFCITFFICDAHENKVLAQDTLAKNRLGISVSNLLVSQLSLSYEYVKNRNSSLVSVSYGINPVLVNKIVDRSVPFANLFHVRVGEKIFLHKTKRNSQWLISVNLSYLEYWDKHKDVMREQINTFYEGPYYNQSQNVKRIGSDINIHLHKFLNRKLMFDYYFGFGAGLKKRSVVVHEIINPNPFLPLRNTPYSFQLNSFVIFPLVGIKLFWVL